jgi:hypothetical protein
MLYWFLSPKLRLSTSPTLGTQRPARLPSEAPETRHDQLRLKWHCVTEQAPACSCHTSLPIGPTALACSRGE